MALNAGARNAVVGEVRVYCADIDSAWARASQNLLADQDLARLADLRHERRRREYLTSRALLRFALQDYTGRPARSHHLRVASTGKPECVDGPAISVSHSAHLAACAIAPLGQVGLDIQLPTRGRRTDDIASQHFTAAENEWLRGHSPEGFYMLWVLKEAYLKATGVGLAGGLDSLECLIDPPTIRWRTANSDDAPTLALYAFDSGFLGLATTGYRFSPARTTFAGPADSGTLPAMQLMASSP